MSNFAPRGYVASCTLDMTALPAAALIDNDGFDATASTDNGVGDWTITLGALRAINAEDRHVALEIVGATPGMKSYVNTSNTQIRIVTLNAAGAAADFTVSIVVTRKSIGTS